MMLPIRSGASSPGLRGGSCPVRRDVRWLLITSVLRVPFTPTQVTEDFSVGIHQRFGLPLLLAAFLLAPGYAARMVGVGLSASAALEFTEDAG